MMLEYGVTPNSGSISKFQAGTSLAIWHIVTRMVTSGSLAELMMS